MNEEIHGEMRAVVDDDNVVCVRRYLYFLTLSAESAQNNETSSVTIMLAAEFDF